MSTSRGKMDRLPWSPDTGYTGVEGHTRTRRTGAGILASLTLGSFSASNRSNSTSVNRFPSLRLKRLRHWCEWAVLDIKGQEY